MSKSGLFSGVVYCSDCGSKLYFHTREVHNNRQQKIEIVYNNIGSLDASAFAALSAS